MENKRDYTKKLAEYVRSHSEALPAQSGREGAINLGFKDIVLQNKPDAEEFKRILEEAQLATAFNPLDGKEHNYITLGGWIGDQQLALRFMGMVEALGMGNVLSPRRMLGNDIPPELEQQFLNMGMLSLKAPTPAQDITPTRADGKLWTKTAPSAGNSSEMER